MTIVGGRDRDAEKAGERGSERGERSGRQSWIPVDARAMQRDMQWEMAREKHSALWLLHRQGNSTAAAVAAADGSTRLDNKLRVPPPPPLTLPPPPTPPSPSPSIELPYAHSTCLSTTTATISVRLFSSSGAGANSGDNILLLLPNLKERKEGREKGSSIVCRVQCLTTASSSASAAVALSTETISDDCRLLLFG